MEGVDVLALRKRVGDATGERALLEMEERNLQSAQVYLAAKEPNAVAEDATTGVVPGGDRPEVMLALVQELSAEIEEWIKSTDVALDAASEAVAGKKQFSLAPSDYVRKWIKSVVVDMAKIGDMVKSAVWTPIECTTDEHFVLIVCRTKARRSRVQHRIHQAGWRLCRWR